MEIDDKKYTIVVRGLIKKQDSYFIIFDDTIDQGVWRAPGTNVMDDEQVEDALVRGIKEEINIPVKLNKRLGFAEDKVKINDIHADRQVIFFECTAIREFNNAQLPKIWEKNSKWISLEELKKTQKIEPAMKKMLSFAKIDNGDKQNEGTEN